METTAVISDMIYLESPDALSRIEDPFFAAVKQDLTHLNPQYDTLQRLGKWTGGTDRHVRMWRHADTPNRYYLGVPRGYLGKLQEREAAGEVELVWYDKTVCPDLTFPMPTGKLDDFQEDAVAEMLKYDHGCLQAPTGSGKCLGKGTPILCYNGFIKSVEDIVPEDFLMGPDSLPRRVLSTSSGSGPLFMIIPLRGDPWICNDVHVLTLIHTESNKIIDIPLHTYLSSSPTFKHCHKLFLSPVNFAPSTPLPLDPYFLGVWFGDGTKRTDLVAVSKPDPEIIALCQEMAQSFGLEVHSSGRGTSVTHRITNACRGRKNALLDLLRWIVGPNFTVPHAYLVSSAENRAAFLAGWLDTDGHRVKSGYEIIQKRKDYAQALCFLSRSLGLRATCKEKRVGSCTYYRIHINGECIVPLPLRISRKAPIPRSINKDATRTGFTVTPLGIGEYFGFTLDRDGRFLLGDFTVTHNTNILMSMIPYLKTSTLILVHTKELLAQTRQRCQEWLGVEAGILGGGKSLIKDITVGMIQTLARMDIKAEGIGSKFGAVFVDECLDAETEITTPTGTRSLGSLSVGDQICTPFGTSTRITKLWHVKKEASKYSFYSGHSLISSRDHRVMAREHYGDEILPIGDATSLFVCEYGYILPLQIDFEDYLMGWIYADGTVAQSRGHKKAYIKFGFRKPEKIELFRKWFGDCCSEATNTRGDTIFSLKAAYGHELIGKYGLIPGKKAHIVEIHKNLMDKHSVGVLRGIMDADGARTQGRIAIDLASQICRDQISTLLCFYGIQNTCQNEIQRISPKHSPRWRLTIYGDAINRYNAMIGWGMHSKHWGQMANDWRLKNRRVALKEVQLLGERDLIDIEIEDNHHLFIANGLIVSNCHHSPALTWSAILNKMKARYRYGFTATSWRKDKMEFVIWDVIGPIRAKVTRDAVIDAGRIMWPTVEQIHTNYFYNITDSSQWGAMVTDLISDPQRNALIEQVVISRMRNGTKALILTDRIEHANHLAARLSDFSPALLTGQLTKREREEAMARVRNGAQLTVATIHLLGEGVDVPCWDVLFLVSPLSTGPRVMQALGRIARVAPGKTSATLIDFVDSNVPMLLGAARGRKALYRGDK